MWTSVCVEEHGDLGAVPTAKFESEPPLFMHPV